jgi:hypothetical protein
MNFIDGENVEKENELEENENNTNIYISNK